MKPLGKKASLQVNGQTLNGEYLIIAAGNGTEYGGGYRAMPEAVVDDGIMDLMLIENMPMSRIAKFIPIYRKGNHLTDGEIIDSLKDKITYLRSDKLSIHCDKPLFINVDGEIFKDENADIEVIKGGIRFIVPESAQ